MLSMIFKKLIQMPDFLTVAIDTRTKYSVFDKNLKNYIFITLPVSIATEEQTLFLLRCLKPFDRIPCPKVYSALALTIPY